MLVFRFGNVYYLLTKLVDIVRLAVLFGDWLLSLLVFIAEQ